MASNSYQPSTIFFKGSANASPRKFSPVVEEIDQQYGRRESPRTTGSAKEREKEKLERKAKTPGGTRAASENQPGEETPRRQSENSPAKKRKQPGEESKIQNREKRSNNGQLHMDTTRPSLARTVSRRSGGNSRGRHGKQRYRYDTQKA